jgi:hypothetical protein
LPRRDIALALFAFNVGMELGQLAFIGFVLARAVRRRIATTASLESRIIRIASYVIRPAVRISVHPAGRHAGAGIHRPHDESAKTGLRRTEEEWPCKA